MELAHDPQENDPEFRQLLEQVELKARTQLQRRGEPLGFGSCHALWREMQRILRRRHGLRWRSPAVMNPDVIFD